jgi:hypothetical protein
VPSNETLGRDAAEAFRQRHDLGLQPIGDLGLVIEEATNVDVAILDAPDGHGITVQRGALTMIGVACSPHPMRQRSNLAHELGHLELGTVRHTVDSLLGRARDDDEIAADAFARHLLAPLAGLSNVARERPGTLQLVSDVVQRYGVSPRIACIQLKFLGVITLEQEHQWCSEESASRLALRYGWHAQYLAMSNESRQPRPPRRLLARAVEGYLLGAVPLPVLARLNGSMDVKATFRDLSGGGISPVAHEAVITPGRDANAMTPEQVDALMDTLD